MGPPPFGDGNAERLCCRLIGIGAASMGPPPFGDGNESLGVSTKVCLTASMGPPPFGDGNSTAMVHPTGPPCASMGPPPFGDGNAPMPPDPLRTPNGFNGATAFRRWKPSITSPSRSVASTLQWGHRLSAMETSGTVATGSVGNQGFNGATAFRRWKLGDIGLDVEVRSIASMGPPPFGDGNEPGMHVWNAVHAASMGPPPFGDGNAGYYSWPEIRSTGFNGATAFRRWKRGILFLAGNPVNWLQWGHRLSAMETCRISTPHLGQNILLQWGHRLSAMETF